MALEHSIVVVLATALLTLLSVGLLRRHFGRSEANQVDAAAPPDPYSLEKLREPALVWDRETEEIVYANAEAKENFLSPVASQGETLTLRERFIIERDSSHPGEIPSLWKAVTADSSSDRWTALTFPLNSGNLQLTILRPMLLETSLPMPRQLPAEPENEDPKLLAELQAAQQTIQRLEKEASRGARLRDEKEQATEQILENALDGVVLMDSTGTITGWNAQAEKIFGWTRTEAVGRKLSTVMIPPESRAEHERGLKHFLMTGNGPILRKRIEVTALHREGHELPVELAVSPTMHQGRWFFSAFIRDLTDERRMLDALKQNVALLQGIIDNTTAVVYVKHLDGKYFLVNHEYERIFELRRDEIIGKTDHEIFPQETADAFRANDLDALKAGTACVTEEKAMLADGLHYYLSVKFPLYDSSHAPYATCGISTDITDRKRLEEHLLHVQRLEAVGHLAGGVAHDFNNLLTVILGFSDFLMQRMEPNHPWQESVREIQKAAGRAAALTQQLLAFSRKQMLVPVVLDLNQVVENLRTMLAGVMGADISLIVSLDRKLKKIRADEGQLEQVIVNLAMNARDAMPTGGELRIETEQLTIELRERRDEGELPPGEYASLRISDSGHGMNAETLRRIFDPFFTTKELGKGTGLGLASVYGIVRQSGGEIRVESEPGIGTRFSIFLPVADEPQTPMMTTPKPNLPPRGSETILIVEDEEAIRRLASEILSGAGYQVFCASDATEAISQFEQEIDSIDLVIMDLVLPGMSGPQVVERLRIGNPSLGILYISGYDLENQRPELPRPLDGRLLQKPFATVELAEAVREVLDEKLSRASTSMMS